MIEQIASMLHEQWRLTMLDQSTGQFQPRVKVTTDQQWIQVHAGQNRVDIANTSFSDLPEDWKKENLAAAKQALDLIRSSLVLIHDRWVERNESDATDTQMLRYDKLPKEEQEKDLLVLEQALRIIRASLGA